jgi:hypothetical protein
MVKASPHACNNGFEHHVAANFSSVATVAHEATTRYLGTCTQGDRSPSSDTASMAPGLATSVWSGSKLP